MNEALTTRDTVHSSPRWISGEPWEVTFRDLRGYDRCPPSGHRGCWEREAFPTEAEAIAFANGIGYVVGYGDKPAYLVLNIAPESEPRCDLCGEPEDSEPGMVGYDWNGETGNHETCERIAR